MSTASSSLGIKNIGQVSIIVHDLQRATAFYRDTLGLPLLFTAPNLAFFDCGGVRLMLGHAETSALDHPSSILYFRVSDLHVAHRRLVDAIRSQAPEFAAAAMRAHLSMVARAVERELAEIEAKTG